MYLAKREYDKGKQERARKAYEQEAKWEKEVFLVTSSDLKKRMRNTTKTEDPHKIHLQSGDVICKLIQFKQDFSNHLLT